MVETTCLCPYDCSSLRPPTAAENLVSMQGVRKQTTVVPHQYWHCLLALHTRGSLATKDRKKEENRLEKNSSHGYDGARLFGPLEPQLVHLPG